MFLKTSSGYPTPKRRSNGRGACPEKTQSTEGTAALAIRQDWRTNPPLRVRRPSRTQETSALHRGRAVLHMQATLATSQTTWLKAVDGWINDLDMRADGRENRRLIARIVGFNADWSTLTTNTLTWATIAKRTGIKERSVARHLKVLHEAGWIGRVAAGRSAAAKRAGGWKTDDAFLNDAPVYALTCPVGEVPVDINVTPPTLRGYKEFPARAREKEAPSRAASRPSSLKAAHRHPTIDPANRQSPAWPSHVTPSSKDERILAGSEWARRVPALGKLSAKHLAFLAKDFFATGWTLNDLKTALDSMPDGRAHGQLIENRWVPYTGADGIPASRLGHWVNWRLNRWRDAHGGVVASPTQERIRRAEARKRTHEIQRRAEEARRAEIHRRMATHEGQDAKAKAMAQMTSRLPRKRLARKR